jgi:hypothetical protein
MVLMWKVLHLLTGHMHGWQQLLAQQGPVGLLMVKDLCEFSKLPGHADNVNAVSQRTDSSSAFGKRTYLQGFEPWRHVPD